MVMSTGEAWSFFLDVLKILKIDSDDGCTTVNILKTTELHTSEA